MRRVLVCEDKPEQWQCRAAGWGEAGEMINTTSSPPVAGTVTKEFYRDYPDTVSGAAAVIHSPNSGTAPSVKSVCFTGPVKS